MKNFVRKGETLDYPVATNGTAVKSGDLVIAGALIGIAVTNIGLGEVGALNLKGVYEIAKATGAIDLGDKLYYSTTNRNLTKTATDNIYVGVAFESVLSAATSVKLLLTNGI
ncbi:MAG: DUF2190 family protein [Sphingobacteriaceae bacterium]|nr:DUF2190 family protein [Sphingobacteriaceae bacterium]